MAISTLKEQKNIEGILAGLMRELQNLAPHPNHPDNKGPLFSSPSSETSGYKLGQRKVIAANFNQSVGFRNTMDAYLLDLPKRRSIEQWISHYRRRLYALQKQAMTYTPQIAA